MNGRMRELTQNWDNVTHQNWDNITQFIQAAPDLLMACENMLTAWDNSTRKSVAMRGEAIARMRKLVQEINNPT